MQMQSTRSVSPASGTENVQFSAEDLEMAFGGPNPDYELWFKWSFGPAWAALCPSEQLEVDSKIAKLVESCSKAKDLGGGEGPEVEDK